MIYKHKKILLYLLFTILIFLIIKLFSSDSLSNNDIVIISIITTFSSMCFYNSIDKNNEYFNQLNTTDNNSNNEDNMEEDNTTDNMEEDNTEDNTEEDNMDEDTEEDNMDEDTEEDNMDEDTEEDTEDNIEEDTEEDNTEEDNTEEDNTEEDTEDKPENKPEKDKEDKPENKTENKTENKPENKTENKTENKEDEIGPITFPFTFDFIIKIFNDVNNAKNDDNIAKKLIKLSTTSKEFEILLQILQTNIETAYKYLSLENYNKLNDLIINVKLRKEQQQSTKEILPSTNKFLSKMLEQQKYMNDSGFINNMTDNDMAYSMYTPNQHQKLGANDDSLNNGWANDYVLLNTTKWAPEFNHRMYKCKTEKTCPVCPTLTTGYPVRLKEFDNARKILQPDNMNIDYINEKLLTGIS